MTSQTIYQCTAECFSVFDKYLSSSSVHNRDLAEQLRGRLALWDKYSGARAIPGYRLDDRLKGFESVTSAINALLRVIVANVNTSLSPGEAYERGTSGSLNPQDSDPDTTHTLSIKQTFEAIGDHSWAEVALSIKELLSLTRAIRESSFASRDASVPNHYRPPDTDVFERTCQVLLRRRFPNARSTLTEQLSKAITARRNRLLYRRDHEAKLRTRIDHHDPSAEHEHPRSPRGQETVPREPGLGIQGGHHPPLAPSSTHLRPPLETILSRPTQSLALRQRASKTTPSSIIGRIARQDLETRALYPEKPRADPNDPTHGTCPYCFSPLEFPLQDLEWMAHVDLDLQVYVCLSEKCDDPIKFFDTSNAWLSHMLSEHGPDWTTNIHLGLWFCDQDHIDTAATTVFANSVAFEAHLENSHAIVGKKANALRRRKRKRGDAREAGCCPLCEAVSEDASSGPLAGSLNEHIAMHLQSLALMSLPALIQDPDEVESDAALSLIVKTEGDLANPTTADLDPSLDQRLTDSMDQPFTEKALPENAEDTAVTEEREAPELDDENAELLSIVAQRNFCTEQDGQDPEVIQAFTDAESTQKLSLLPVVPAKHDPTLLRLCQKGEEVIRYLHFIQSPSRERRKLLAIVLQLQKAWWRLYARNGTEPGVEDRNLVHASDRLSLVLSRASDILRLERRCLKQRRISGYHRDGAFVPSNMASTPDWPATEKLLLKVLVKGRHWDRVDIQGWLSPPDVAAKYHRTLEQLHPGTCSWIFEDPVFRNWENDVSGKLCLYGFPGCGKTIMSSHLIQHLTNVSQRIVLYFYFDFGDPEKQTLEALLRSLISQLADQKPELRPLIELLLLSEDNHRQLESLSTCLHEGIMLALAMDAPVVLVLDALDECSTIDVLLAWLQAQRCFFVTSRPEKNIEQGLREHIGAKDLQFPDHNVEADIRTFVRERLRSGEDSAPWRHRPELQTAIEKELVKKSNGMFRWVSLYLDELEDCSDDSSLQETLSAMPQTLAGMYDRMLSKISSANRESAIRILQVLVYCTRPPSLTELVSLIAVDVDGSLASFPEFDSSASQSCDVQNVCSGFVTVSGDNSVLLAHMTVKHYFTTPNVLPADFRQQFKESHARACIVQRCIGYLDIISGQPRQSSHSFPASKFAANEWPEHARFVGQTDDVAWKWIHKLFTSRELFVCWRTIYDSLELDAGALYYAAMFGLHMFVKRLLDEEHDPNAQPGRVGYPLQAAAFGGHEETTHLLVEHGADVDAQGGQFGNALQAASAAGHYGVVELLLEAGADADARGAQDGPDPSGTAIQLASANGHIEIVRKLLECGADVNVQGGPFRNALRAASAGGHEEIVRVLLDHGASTQTLASGSAKAPMEGSHQPPIVGSSDDGSDSSENDYAEFNVAQKELVSSGSPVKAREQRFLQETGPQVLGTRFDKDAGPSGSFSGLAPVRTTPKGPSSPGPQQVRSASIADSSSTRNEIPTLAQQTVSRLDCPYWFHDCNESFHGLNQWITHISQHFGHRDNLPRRIHCPFTRCMWATETGTGLEAWRAFTAHINANHSPPGPVDTSSGIELSMAKHLCMIGALSRAQLEGLNRSGRLRMDSLID